MTNDVAEHGDVIAQAFITEAEVENGPPVEVVKALDDADIHKAYVDASELWKSGTKRVLRSGLLFYNSLYPLDSIVLNVLEYLQHQRDVAGALKEA